MIDYFILQVPARLALGFCDMTKSQLSKAMSMRPHDVDVSALLHAHKVMAELELLLARKYYAFTTRAASLSVSVVNDVDSKPGEAEDGGNTFLNVEESKGNESQPKSPYINSICSCFYPHLSVYIENVDKRLSSQVEKFAVDMKNYKFEHIDAEESNVVPCCGELFTIYKNVLVEYLKLSSGENLSSLAEVMQKHLREFGTKVLRASLPRVGAGLPNLSRDLNMKELTAVLAQVQTLWREGDQAKLSEDDVRRACSVLVSSEYCEEMTSRLETKLRQKSSSGNISLTVEQDVFHAVLAESIALLVTHVESQCEAALSTMPRHNWMPDQTGDQSSFVTAVSSILGASVPLIRHNLHTSRKYFTR